MHQSYLNYVNVETFQQEQNSSNTIGKIRHSTQKCAKALPF